MFVDTSSLLPNADTSLRNFTSILTLSHTPASTYIGTSPPKDKDKTKDKDTPITPTLITIPSSAVDSFTQLVGTKLQPQWAHRQALLVENGTSLALDGSEWTVRIGDLKIPARPNQAGNTVRALLLELSHHVDPANDSNKPNTLDKDDESMIRGFLDSLLDGTGVQLDNTTNTRAMFRRTKSPVQHDDSDKGPAADFALATLYMDMLRGSRG